MEVMKQLNLVVRFLLEIMALVIIGYWGFQTPQGTFLKFVFAIGSPLVLAIIWGMFGTPKAPCRLSGTSFLFLEIIVFGLPVVALLLIDKTTFASIYGVVVILNLVLMKVWHQ